MIKENSFYRHYKGKTSFVIGVAKHSENDDEFVIYRLENGELRARPIADFLGKTKDGQQRFVLVEVNGGDTNV